MRGRKEKHYHVLDYEGIAKITVVSTKKKIIWSEWLQENPKAKTLLGRVIRAHVESDFE